MRMQVLSWAPAPATYTRWRQSAIAVRFCGGAAVHYLAQVLMWGVAFSLVFGFLSKVVGKIFVQRQNFAYASHRITRTAPGMSVLTGTTGGAETVVFQRAGFRDLSPFRSEFL